MKGGILRKIIQQKVKTWYSLVSTYLSQHGSSSLSIWGISKLSKIVGTREPGKDSSGPPLSARLDIQTGRQREDAGWQTCTDKALLLTSRGQKKR